MPHGASKSAPGGPVLPFVYQEARRLTPAAHVAFGCRRVSHCARPAIAHRQRGKGASLQLRTGITESHLVRDLANSCGDQCVTSPCNGWCRTPRGKAEASKLDPRRRPQSVRSCCAQVFGIYPRCQEPAKRPMLDRVPPPRVVAWIERNVPARPRSPQPF